MKIGSIELEGTPLFLAPMEDVTYKSFRHICKQNGVDVLYTEFVSSEALIRDVEKTRLKMELEDDDRPIAIQIYGYDIESMANAARIAEELQPDFIDINFGCPMKKIVKKGACSALLQDLPKMQQMAAEVVKSVSLPVTAKTRLGWDENNKVILEAAERLQDIGISALAIHGRTRSQLYTGDADWTMIGEVKNSPKIKIPIIGNGDINGPEKAAELLKQTGVDGLMIGRGAIGRPWIFNEIKHYLKTGEFLQPPTVAEIIAQIKDQLRVTADWKGNETTAILMMRRHFARYFPGIDNFRDHRIKMLQATQIEDLDKIMQDIVELYGDLRVDYTNVSLK
ncbi:tRNA dihydrouridine synthase DusB [Mangrovibacterium diazotrophicum]|uniref:tRNA-dihydrouridine synthase n=1 Tax=Mangrovibacterium diazotrophicum TaxID=1261403 RepID=A0A419W9F7_9BACT|nr:tRNA dihydrouridine synthase DusB [Mangrovibacterium diazotrophicum]RKD92097.1 tRNA-U20-dihydrouridine synthase [Mangrovibacterium diazotrophicum]